MLDLPRIASPADYLPGRVSIRLLAGDGEAAFIDTGLDESGARKALQAIERAQPRVTTIVNTHARADHCGGNAFLVKRTGAPVYAPPVEAGIVEYTQLEPFPLFGAAPFKEIDSKWLHAAPSRVDHLLAPPLTLCGAPLQILPVPGHSITMAGLATAEVAYLADALLAPEILDRSPVQYGDDVLAHRATLARLRTIGRSWFVGGHFPPTDRLEPLLAANAANLERTATAVIEALDPAATTDGKALI